MSEDFTRQIFAEQFFGRIVPEHFLERRIYLEEPAGGVCAINSIRCVFDNRPKTSFQPAESLLRSFALGDVAIHDDQLFWLTIGILDHAGSRFQYKPGAILVAKAVFQSFSDTRAAGLRSGILNALTIIGVNLLETRRGLQFFLRISQNLLIRHTVENPLPVHIDDGDHVGGVFADQVKQLFPINELTADSMNQ